MSKTFVFGTKCFGQNNGAFKRTTLEIIDKEDVNMPKLKT